MVVLGGLGRCFGALGGSGMASWAVLAASWGVFGASWAVLGRHGSIFVVLSSTRWGSGTQLAPKRDPSWQPEWEQKRTKIDVKNEDEKRQSLRSSWSRLGSILGRSWVPSWGQNRALALGGARFFENRLFEGNGGSRGDLGRSWVDLGRPRGVKMRAAEGLKRS